MHTIYCKNFLKEFIKKQESLKYFSKECSLKFYLFLVIKIMQLFVLKKNIEK